MGRRIGLKKRNLSRPRRQCRAERSRPRDLGAHFAMVKNGNQGADQDRPRFWARTTPGSMYSTASNRLSVYLHSPRFRLSVRHGAVGAPKHFTLIFHIALFAVFGMVNLLPQRLESIQRIHSVRR